MARTAGDSPDARFLQRAHWAFTTRRVPREVATQLINGPSQPTPGDLVLARIDALGHHGGLQLPSGRRRTLFVGDHIVVAYGNRYASSQFEAVVPDNLGPCHLVAGGGVAGKALSWHDRIHKGPTQITPLGLVADRKGQRINLRDHALAPAPRLPDRIPTAVVVVGTAMDSGKTQSCAYLVKGLTLAGLRVGYAKVTGTGAGGDTWLLHDSGAYPVLDFTDAGHVSTYLATHAEVQQIYITLMANMAEAGVDAVVLEIADGVLQQETAELMAWPTLRDTIGGVLCAARDSMGGMACMYWLQDRGLPVLGMSGVVTAAPLQEREVSLETKQPLYSRADLAEPATAMQILALAQRNLASGSAPPRATQLRQVESNHSRASVSHLHRRAAGAESVR